MKKIVISILLAAIALSPSFTQELDGRQIAETVEKKNQSATGLVSKGTILLEDLKANKTESRSFTLIGLSLNGLRNAMFRFTDSRYKDTTFLTIEMSDGDKIQYVFLKSVGSPRQVEASDKEKNFVDTDMSYEDLGGAKTSDYDYKRLEDRQVNGRDCYTIEKYPKRKNSKFQKHLILIDKATFVPVAAKYFSVDGRVVKTLTADDIRPVGTGINVPYSISVTDLVEQHRTSVTIKSAGEKPLSAGYFSKGRMDKSWAD